MNVLLDRLHKTKSPYYTQIWWLEIWKLYENFRSLQKTWEKLLLIKNMTKESTPVMQTKWWPSIIYGIVTYFQRHKKSRKKIQNTRGYTGRKLRRLSKFVIKDQNDKWKSWRTKMYKIGKIGNPILIDKGPQWWKYFYLG